MRRALVPFVAGLLGLAGTLAATLYLHRAADAALDRVLEERMLGAGETAAEMVGRSVPSTATLRAVMKANQLEGIFLLSPTLEVLADATGTPGGRADLLRVDRQRVARALAGDPSLGFSFAVGNVKVRPGTSPCETATGRSGRYSAWKAGRRSQRHETGWAGRSGAASPCPGSSPWRLPARLSSGHAVRSRGKEPPPSRRAVRRFPGWRLWF